MRPSGAGWLVCVFTECRVDICRDGFLKRFPPYQEFGQKSKMLASVERVIGTVELLEQILLHLPLREMLCIRQVSRRFEELIMSSKYLKSLQESPYIGIKLRLPQQCSLSGKSALNLDADLTLYFDRSITIRQTPSCLSTGSSQMTFKSEEGTSAPSTFPWLTWGARFRSGAFQFNRANEARWMTLVPGEPQTISWDFRFGLSIYRGSNPKVFWGDLGQTEIGKTYILSLRPDHAVQGFIGMKEPLLAQRESGISLKAYGLAKTLPLVGENQVRSSVVA